MAHVNDVTINYGSTGDGRAYADIQFSVNFDQQELGQNTPFGMYLGLFAPEQMYANGWGQPNGFNTNRAPYGAAQQHFASSLFGMNQPSNLVWSSRETITPNGYRSLALSRRVTLNQVADQSQLPQLTAHIWMVPEHYEHRGMPYIGQYLRMNNPSLWQSFQRYFPAFYNAYQQPGMLGQNGFGEYYGPAYYHPAFGGQFGNGQPWSQPFAAQGQHSPNTVGMSAWGNPFGGGNSFFGGNGAGNGFGFNPWNGGFPSAYSPFGLNSARAFGRGYANPFGSGFGNGYFGQPFGGQMGAYGAAPAGSFAGVQPHTNGVAEPFAY